jgi:hypothetical protein
MSDNSGKMDKARVVFVLGDRTQDGKLDVSVEVWGKVPVVGTSVEKMFTLPAVNIPVDKMIAMGATLAGQLPGVAGAVAAAVLANVKVITHP